MVTQQPGKFWLFPLLMALFPAISVMTIKTSLLLSHTVRNQTHAAMKFISPGSIIV